MPDYKFITALGTPLDAEDRLSASGLEQHLDDQAKSGVSSLLVAGTMGAMPLLKDETWRDLIRQCTAFNRGRFEMLVGATDSSVARVLDRIAYLDTVEGIDGVVVMAPGVLWKFTQAEFIAYFRAIADASSRPVLLYDLQPLTGVHLTVETVMRLAEHPNISGIKLSANVPEAARLKHRLTGSDFRLIVAEPTLSDMLFRHGYKEQLDGIYAIAPHWATALAEAARRGDWASAAEWQEKLSQIKDLFGIHSLSMLFTALMNLRGLPGFYTPQPLARPDDAFIQHLKTLPIVHELLAPDSVAVSV